MTRTQVESALTSKGFNTGEWLSLGDSFKYILRASDKGSFTTDSAVQFFCSEIGDYLLVRQFTGSPVLTTELEATPAGFVKVVHEGKFYFLKLISGGILDQSADNAGVYHTLLSFDLITGIFYK
jgi:hypothetical protein